MPMTAGRLTSPWGIMVRSGVSVPMISPQISISAMGSILSIMKMFCTVLPSFMPKILMAVRTMTMAMPRPFCISSLPANALSGIRLAMAAENATARAAMDPDDPRMKFEKPLMKATFSP